MGNLFSSKKQQDIYQSQFINELEQFIIKLNNLYVNNENCINNINISKNNNIINSILESDNDIITSLFINNTNPQESAKSLKESIENILIGNKIVDNNVNNISNQICSILKTYYSNYTELLTNIISIFKYLINRHSTLFTTRCNIPNKNDKISMTQLNYIKDIKGNLKNNLKNILVPKLLINSKELCDSNNGKFLMSYRQLVNNNLILLLFYEEDLPISFSMILDNPTIPLKDDERKIINHHNVYLNKLKNIYDEYIEITLDLYKMLNKILIFKNSFKEIFVNNAKFDFKEKYISSEKYNLYNRDLLNILYKISSIENKLNENINDTESILNIRTTTDLNTLNNILSKNKFNKIYNIPENIKLVDETKIENSNLDGYDKFGTSIIEESKPRDYLLVNKSVYDWFNEYKNKYQDDFYNKYYLNSFNQISNELKAKLNNIISKNNELFDSELINAIIKEYKPNNIRNLNDINLTNALVFFEEKYIKDNKNDNLVSDFSKKFTIDYNDTFIDLISILISNIKYNYIELSLDITKSIELFDTITSIFNKINLTDENELVIIFENKEYIELIIEYYKLVIQFLYTIISYNQYQNTLLINDLYEVQIDKKLKELPNIKNDNNLLNAKKLIKFLKSNALDGDKKKDDIIDTINLFIKEIPEIDMNNFFKSYITDLAERLNVNYLYLKYLMVDNYIPFNNNWLSLGTRVLENDKINYENCRNFYNELIFKIYPLKYVLSNKSYFSSIYFYDELSENYNRNSNINYYIKNISSIIKNINDILNNKKNEKYFNDINTYLNKLLSTNKYSLDDYNLFLVNFIKYIANQFLNEVNKNNLDANEILVTKIKELFENFNYLSKTLIETLNTDSVKEVKEVKKGGAGNDKNEEYINILIKQLTEKYINITTKNIEKGLIKKNIESIVKNNDMMAIIRLKNNIGVGDLLLKEYSPATSSTTPAQIFVSKEPS
jgi:hypothetical protein